jgi:anthranilate 1,2-dioxygenase small subunit
MLIDRVMALRKANIYEPQRYRHLIGAIKIGAEEQGIVSVVANLIVVRIMQDGAMILFAAGRYVDRLVRQGDSWKFAKKDVVLDSRQIDTLLAIPL